MTFSVNEGWPARFGTSKIYQWHERWGGLLFFGINAAVRGDVAVKSTSLGREQGAVRLFFKSDAVVRARAETAKQIRLLRIFTGCEVSAPHRSGQGSRGGQAGIAIEILERITIQIGAGPRVRGQQVNAWWSATGSSDPRYR